MNKFLVEYGKEDAFIFHSAAQAKAFCDNPNLDFSFDPNSADDGNKALQVKIVGNPPSASEISTTVTERKGKDVYVHIRVMFRVSVKGSYTEDNFDLWAESQGGYICVLLEPSTLDWDSLEDFAGEVYLGTKNEYGHSFSVLYPD